MMDMKHLLCALAVVGSTALMADGIALASSTNFTFSVDTTDDLHVIKSLDAVTLPYRTAHKVTATCGDTSVSVTLVESAARNDDYAWIPSAGGLWTLVNSVEGTATFLVRYSLFPETAGAGTSVKPAKIVDAEELAELISAGTASYGYVFEPCGLLTVSAIELPSGWALQGVTPGVYRIVAASADVLYQGAGTPFAVDSLCAGPDRTWYRRKPVDVAYSGDNWTGAPSAVSTLTVASPSGAKVDESLTGTGAYAFRPMEKGVYTLTMSTPSTNLVSSVSVIPQTFRIDFR